MSTRFSLRIKRAVARACLLSRVRLLTPGLRAGVLALTLSLVATGPAFAAQGVTPRVSPATTPTGVVEKNPSSNSTVAPISSPLVISPVVAGPAVPVNVPVPAAPLPAPVIVGSTALCPAFAIDANGNTVRTLSPCPPPDPMPVASAILSAPYHSQFDGSAYAQTNCGPTALSMALGALKISVGQLTLRQLANTQMGTSDPNSGTTWEALAYAAKAKGATISGLYSAQGKGYRSWSIDDLKRELGQGHPVLLLVRYRDLPGNAQSPFNSDHFIVALGIDRSGNLVYDDPAFSGNAGSDRAMSPATLTKAWTNTSEGLVQTAMALSA